MLVPDPFVTDMFAKNMSARAELLLQLHGAVTSRRNRSTAFPTPSPVWRARTPVHQSLVWSRQRQTNTLRSMLREYYPAALAAFDELAGRDAMAVLAAAPTPANGRRLTVKGVERLLRAGGRQRNLTTTAERIVTMLRSQQLAARPGVVAAYGASVSALVAVISELVRQTAKLAEQVEAGFGRHPDAEIYLSQPGLGTIPRWTRWTPGMFPGTPRLKVG